MAQLPLMVCSATIHRSRMYFIRISWMKTGNIFSLPLITVCWYAVCDYITRANRSFFFSVLCLAIANTLANGYNIKQSLDCVPLFPEFNAMCNVLYNYNQRNYYSRAALDCTVRVNRQIICTHMRKIYHLIVESISLHDEISIKECGLTFNLFSCETEKKKTQPTT